jgi:uncharacterized protein YraI/beta-lactamase class A
LLIVWLLVSLLIPVIVQAQSTDVTAEALNQANLRAAPNVDSELLGSISAGTRYPVIGRSQFFPWLLLADPTTRATLGWVFQDLVTVTGNLNQIGFTEQQVTPGQIPPTVLPSATPGAASPQNAPAAPTATTVAGTPPPSTGVTGLVTAEINLRYGPGVDYPRIGVARAGDTFDILAWHTQFPWVQVRYPAAPNGLAWVAVDLLTIEGNLYNLPSLSQLTFDLPTLTPTASVIQQVNLAGATAVPISPAFAALGDELWGMMLNAGFQPETSTLGGLFLMNLNSGEAITFGNDVAFSGMSLSKIAILAALYDKFDAPLPLDVAIEVANMMICSENSASNALLARLGDGDMVRGGAYITDFLRRLGLQNMYIVAPYRISAQATPAPVTAPTTGVDQVRAQPDIANQMTVGDMGQLLAGIYQCAIQATGPLLNFTEPRFNPGECRQMLGVMSINNLDQPLMMSAGVPAGTRVAHKHGYINDTHGNAGIVFTPGGDFVLVTALHAPTWLDFQVSFPLITNMARETYNYFNPTTPLDANRDPFIVPVEECQVTTNPIIDELTSINYAG